MGHCPTEEDKESSGVLGASVVCEIGEAGGRVESRLTAAELDCLVVAVVFGQIMHCFSSDFVLSSLDIFLLLGLRFLK